MLPRAVACTFLLASAGLAVGCRDTATRFSNKGDHYEGDVVKGSFVRAGVADDVRMCVTFDVDRLQDAPGTVTTTDGRFRATPLRPIPQIWHDPLSTLSFGDGRLQNLVYVATPGAPPTTDAGTAQPGDSQDVFVFVSLMDEGGLEVRLVRGAPQSDAGAAAAGATPPMFGVFALARREGTCSF